MLTLQVEHKYVWLPVAEGCFYNPNTDVWFWMCDSTADSVIAISGSGCAINRACMSTPILVFLHLAVSHFSLSHSLTKKNSHSIIVLLFVRSHSCLLLSGGDCSYSVQTLVPEPAKCLLTAIFLMDLGAMRSPWEPVRGPRR